MSRSFPLLAPIIMLRNNGASHQSLCNTSQQESFHHLSRYSQVFSGKAGSHLPALTQHWVKFYLGRHQQNKLLPQAGPQQQTKYESAYLAWDPTHLLDLLIGACCGEGEMVLGYTVVSGYSLDSASKWLPTKLSETLPTCLFSHLTNQSYLKSS